MTTRKKMNPWLEIVALARKPASFEDVMNWVPAEMVAGLPVLAESVLSTSKGPYCTSLGEFNTVVPDFFVLARRNGEQYFVSTEGATYPRYMGRLK